MMAIVSDCGQLHDKLWKLSGVDKLFARVLSPEDVINVLELDNTVPATHSAVESAKVCYASPLLEDRAPVGSLQSHFVHVRTMTESQITAAQKESVPVNPKRTQTGQ